MSTSYISIDGHFSIEYIKIFPFKPIWIKYNGKTSQVCFWNILLFLYVFMYFYLYVFVHSTKKHNPSQNCINLKYFAAGHLLCCISCIHSLKLGLDVNADFFRISFEFKWALKLLWAFCTCFKTAFCKWKVAAGME